MTKDLSKGFTGIEVNGVRFSNLSEMLQHLNKQRERIIALEKGNAELKEKLKPENCLKLLAKKRLCEVYKRQPYQSKRTSKELVLHYSRQN